MDQLEEAMVLFLCCRCPSDSQLRGLRHVRRESLGDVDPEDYEDGDDLVSADRTQHRLVCSDVA